MAYRRWLIATVLITVITGTVWFASKGRHGESLVLNQVPSNSSSKHTLASAEQVSTEPPIVSNSNGTLQFRIKTLKPAHVKKVEYYVSNQLVGVAYSSPFVVSVPSDNLMPGNHVVSAKVFTDTSAADTPSTTFTTAPSSPASPVSSSALPPTTGTSTDSPSVPPEQPAQSSSHIPSNAAAIVQNDTTVLLTWNAPEDGTAVSYQVWRDGNLLTSTTNTTYSDATVSSGGTYDYQITAIDSVGASSQPSETAAVTVPTNKTASFAPADGSEPASADTQVQIANPAEA